MNNNLPKIRKEGIFNRIKKWLNNILGIGEIVGEPVQKDTNNSKNNEEIKKSNFKEEIKVKSKDAILALQRKIDEKQIEISDLTDEQLDEIIELYKNQIEEKENKIRYYKEILMKN